MEGLNFFNPYEIRARIFPSIIVLLPMIVLFLSILPLSNTTWNVLMKLGILIVVVYGFSYVVRMLGVRFQVTRWKLNGGAPSTIIMRWTDPTFSQELKQQLYTAIAKKYAIIIPNGKEQETDSNQFDQTVIDAFSRIRSDLHKCGDDKLCSIHNSEYGFVRNLVGSRLVWLAMSIFCTFLGSIFYYFEPSSTHLLAACVNFIFCVVSLIGGWVILPKIYDYIGYEYAKSAWMTFLTSLAND